MQTQGQNIKWILINGKFFHWFIMYMRWRCWKKHSKFGNLLLWCEFNVIFFSWFFLYGYSYTYFYQNVCFFSRFSIMARVVVVTVVVCTAYCDDGGGGISVCINVWYVNGIHAWTKVVVNMFLFDARKDIEWHRNRKIYID